MIPLMAIFSLLSEVPALFSAGKELVETVTGKSSSATSASDLQVEVNALPEDQRAAWQSQMETKVAAYKAETDRLQNEQGDITDTLIAKVGEKAASKIALLRMTTRPLVVRRMSHYLMAPLYLMAVDGCLAFINLWLVFFESTKTVGYLAATFFSADTVYSTMYAAGVAPAATIVVTYMTLRQIEKAGHPNPVASAGKAIKNILGAFK